jgi:DNA repair photolyase
MSMSSSLRWSLADEERNGQTALFDVDGLTGPQRSSGRLSGIEFLHVTAKRIINEVPRPSRVPFRWTINVYRGCSHACVYCFARPTHAYLGLSIGADFDRKIVVKINAVERVRSELAHPGWSGDPIAMGTNTDPYQRGEGKYRLTRGVLEALAERGNPFSILTKSALVARDLDVIAHAAERAAVQVNFSIGTLDERVWRATEPGTPHPRRRLEAMRTFAAAGVRTGALIAPILPGLSDEPGRLREVARAVTDTGGRVIGVAPLHLRPGTREHFLEWLSDFDPTLHADYLRRYRTGAYAPRHYTDWLRSVVAEESPSGDR